MVAELVSASSGTNFGQLIRGDPDEEMEKLKCVVSETVLVTQKYMKSHTEFSRRLMIVAAKSLWDGGSRRVGHGRGTEPCVLGLLRDAAPLSDGYGSSLIVADGTFAQVVGYGHKLPVFFGILVVPLGFLVVRNSPFGAIIGSLSLEFMQANLIMVTMVLCQLQKRRRLILLEASFRELRVSASFFLADPRTKVIFWDNSYSCLCYSISNAL